jgi:hypothetical protein
MMRYVLGHLGGTCAIALLVAGLTITLAYVAPPALLRRWLRWYIAWCHMTWLPVSASSSSLSFRRQRILRILLSGVAPASTATFLALRHTCPNRSPNAFSETLQCTV